MRWHTAMRLDHREELLHDPVDTAQERAQKDRNTDHNEGQVLGSFGVGPCNFLQFRDSVKPLLLDFIKSCADRRSLLGAVTLPLYGRLRRSRRLRSTLRQHRLWLDDSLAPNAH